MWCLSQNAEKDKRGASIVWPIVVGRCRQLAVLMPQHLARAGLDQRLGPLENFLLHRQFFSSWKDLITVPHFFIVKTAVSLLRLGSRLTV